MEKRLVIAIVLSVLVIALFQNLTVKPNHTQAPQVIPQEVVVAEKNVTITKEKSIPAAPILLDEKECIVEADNYTLVFSNIGGSIKDIYLKMYREKNSNSPLELVRLSDPKEYIGAINFPLEGINADTSPYELEMTEDTVKYSFKSSTIEIAKIYSINKRNNRIDLAVTLTNISNARKVIASEIIGGANIIDKEKSSAQYLEVLGKVDGKIVGYKAPKGKKIINPGIVEWTALKSRYFSLILKPATETKSQFYNESKNGYVVTGIDLADKAIEPGEYVEQKFVLYAGPSKISDLKKYNIGLEETVNYGFFAWIAKAMLSVMSFFYNIVHSWGVAIILLSVFLNILLFPLSMQSFNSMKKMQELHPEMEKIKAHHKENPQKMNKEMMELYKKYKINPLSGCLPLILQMPIFIALYQALMKSVDLKGAQFLWIRDLSLPDAVKLPGTLPLLGDSINILPIFMIVGMVIQQKISSKSMGGAVTDEQKQQQKMMLIMMPIMFGFIFYNMPSGLVLYWLVNTVLTIGEQYMIFKKT